jgi:hypothetical protein
MGGLVASDRLPLGLRYTVKLDAAAAGQQQIGDILQRLIANRR